MQKSFKSDLDKRKRHKKLELKSLKYHKQFKDYKM